MAKLGRPTDYKNAYPKQAEKLCRLGATDAELADFFEVDVRTIYRWKAAHEAFCQALKSGKDEADDRVERSLYHRAVGYEHPDVHISNYQGVVTATPIVKHYPPDTTAGIFWLKNRRKDDWRDKQEHEHSGNVEFTKIERLILNEEDAESRPNGKANGHAHNTDA